MRICPPGCAGSLRGRAADDSYGTLPVFYFGEDAVVGDEEVDVSVRLPRSLVGASVVGRGGRS